MKRARLAKRKTVRIGGKKRSTPEPATRSGDRGQDVRKLVHLLQVNQVELEHQNQELRITEQELEASRTKYVNLFDFSPIPYFILDMGGVIKEVNLCAARMFGADRKRMIGKNIVTHVQSEDKNLFNGFIKALFQSPEKQSVKVRVISRDKREFFVAMEGVKSSETLEPELRCQIALIDLTEYKKLEDAFRKLSVENELLNAGRE
jgi:PAS domain S-box-containing protein